jgi:hypothetical protein
MRVAAEWKERGGATPIPNPTHSSGHILREYFPPTTQQSSQFRKTQISPQYGKKYSIKRVSTFIF